MRTNLVLLTIHPRSNFLSTKAKSDYSELKYSRPDKLKQYRLINPLKPPVTNSLIIGTGIKRRSGPSEINSSNVTASDNLNH